MQKISLILILLIPVLNANAQKKEINKNIEPKWGIVSPSDLKMTVYPLDSSADAVVLDNYGEMELGNDLPTYINFKMHKRVKIFKKSAFDSEGLVEIHYYVKDKEHDVAFSLLHAQILYPDGKVTPLAQKDFLDEKINDKNFYKKILFPAIQEGCILEYEYQTITKFTGDFNNWYFQENIPTRHSELKVNAPDFYGFIWGRHGAHPVKEIKLDNTFFNYTSSIVSDKGKVYHLNFSSDSIPAIRKDAFMTNINDYITAYYFQLRQYAYPGEGIQNYLKDWDGFASDLYTQSNFGNFTHRGNFSDVWKAVKDEVTGLANDSMKVEFLHKFVKNNIEWNDEYHFIPEESLNKVYKQKKGSSADINLLLVGLLNEAEIKTFPVILGTRSKGKPIEEYPILDDYNYVIGYTEINGKSILLDATDPLLSVNMVRLDALNGKGVVLDKKKPRWVSISAPSGMEQHIVNVDLDEQNTLSGSLTTVYKGYDAYVERHLGNSIEALEKATKKYLTEAAPDIQVDSITRTNLKELNEPYRTNVKFKLPNAAGSVGDLMYFNPTIFADYRENPFKQKSRSYPVEIPYKQNKQTIVNLKIPENYEVVDVPKSIKIALPGNDASFLYAISKTNNVVQVSVKLSINRLQYVTENYLPLKEFFDQVAAKLSEQIVLKKK